MWRNIFLILIFLGWPGRIFREPIFKAIASASICPSAAWTKITAIHIVVHFYLLTRWIRNLKRWKISLMRTSVIDSSRIQIQEKVGSRKCHGMVPFLIIFLVCCMNTATTQIHHYNLLTFMEAVLLMLIAYWSQMLMRFGAISARWVWKSQSNQLDRINRSALDFRILTCFPYFICLLCTTFDDAQVFGIGQLSMTFGALFLFAVNTSSFS